jgi:tetratricopeptide (TPR) repeat protein
VRKYKKALKYVNLLRESMGSSDEDEEVRIRAVEVPCCLNIAAVMVKESNFEEALKQCEKVLEIEPENKKALFRRGQARFGLNDYELAVSDLTKLKELEPHDKSVILELTKVKKAMQEYCKKEKKLYGKMFQ